MREFARQQAVIYFEVGRMGIEHVLLPEQGLVLPGDVVVGADSHTCTYGAVGAFSTGMGSTDVAVAMATGEIWMKVPETIRFVYRGKLNRWVGGKDLILFTIGNIGVEGANYQVMEFVGEAIDNLSMEGRFTIANMAIEAGAKAGIFRADARTMAYLKGRARRQFEAVEGDGEFSRLVEYDVSTIEPQVAFPSSPAKMSKTPGGVHRPAPLLGEHHEEVFGGLMGLTGEEIAGLEAEKVISTLPIWAGEPPRPSLAPDPRRRLAAGSPA